MVVANFGIIPCMGKKTNKGRTLNKLKDDQAMGVVYRMSGIKGHVSLMTIIDHS